MLALILDCPSGLCSCRLLCFFVQGKTDQQNEMYSSFTQMILRKIRSNLQILSELPASFSIRNKMLYRVCLSCNKRRCCVTENHFNSVEKGKSTSIFYNVVLFVMNVFISTLNRGLKMPENWIHVKNFLKLKWVWSIELCVLRWKIFHVLGYLSWSPIHYQNVQSYMQLTKDDIHFKKIRGWNREKKEILLQFLLSTYFIFLSRAFSQGNRTWFLNWPSSEIL